jgi:hypothetical protein
MRVVENLITPFGAGAGSKDEVLEACSPGRLCTQSRGCESLEATQQKGLGINERDIEQVPERFFYNWTAMVWKKSLGNKELSSMHMLIDM